jgi:hypothetical protein
MVKTLVLATYIEEPFLKGTLWEKNILRCKKEHTFVMVVFDYYKL